MNAKKCAVIGAGIQGLFTAYFLAKKGHDVTIFTADDPLKTTSIAAGAIWMPYKVYPETKALECGKESLAYYRELAQKKHSGVIFKNHTEFFDAKVERPAWMNLAGLEYREAYYCKKPNTAICSHSVKIPLIDTYKLIAYLIDELTRLNVQIIRKFISNFQELIEYKYIVNTTGVGAKQLAGDITVYPIKGQTFSLSQPSQSITESIFYHTDLLKILVVPHDDKVVVGITYDENDNSKKYDEEKESELFQSACSFYPALKESKILDRRVGHRPGRPEVRLEYEVINDQHIFHNYGHGGAGIALAPGCASAIVELFEKNFKKP